MEEALEFAEWIAERGFENTYQDIDGDGKTWANINESDQMYCDNLEVNRETEKRYTTKELWCKYLDED